MLNMEDKEMTAVERQYNEMYVYRVWYDGVNKEAFFTSKEDAEKFAESVNGIINKWSWQIMIEK